MPWGPSKRRLRTLCLIFAVDSASSDDRSAWQIASLKTGGYRKDPSRYPSLSTSSKIIGSQDRLRRMSADC